jgi:hypothetical protein
MMHVRETREIEEALRRCRRQILKQECGKIKWPRLSWRRRIYKVLWGRSALCDQSPAVAELRALERTTGLPASSELRKRASHKTWKRFCKAP